MEMGCVFVEVKTRTSLDFGTPEESITRRKTTQDDPIGGSLHARTSGMGQITGASMSWRFLAVPGILSLKFFGLKMPSIERKLPLVVIVGPTAVGKTEISHPAG